MTTNFKLGVLMIPIINNNVELLRKKEKKRFLTYCPKLHGTRLDLDTFEFVTYDLMP